MSKSLNITTAKVLATSGALLSIALTGTIINASTSAETATSPITEEAATSSAEKTLVDETIYVFTKPDGSVKKVISSDWTKNLGIDEFTKTEKSDKSTPIDLKVSYKLNGETIAANKLSGKSGHVTIRFDYTNKSRVNGYYLPYLVATGVVLDNNNFKNVEVKNGKIFNDGSHSIVAGFALPGMQENLGLSSSAYEIPNYVEISADTTNFQLGMTMSMASSEVFTDIDTSNLDSASALSSELTKLTDAMDKLIGGSSDLYKGIDQLYQESSKLPEGVAALKTGSTKLSAGAKELDTGVAKLEMGVKELYAGINETTNTYNPLLQNGVTAIFTTLLDSTRSQIVSSLSEKLVPALVSKGYTEEQATAQVESLVPELTISGYSSEIDSVLTNVTTFINNLPISNEEKQAYISSISASAPVLNSTKAELGKVAQFHTLVYAYTNGIANTNEDVIKDQLLAGTTDLHAGTSALLNGAEELDNGLSTLDESAPKLVEGVGKLRDGSAQLKDGIKQFNDEGISKLINAYSNIDELLTRVKTIANIAKDNQKPVKYIYRTDEIK